jgi:hypothetical protein
MAAKKKRTALTPEAVEKIGKHLDSIPDPVSDSLSIRKAVDLLIPRIAAMRDKGFTLAEIADHLNSAGLPLAESTLRNYARQPRRRRPRKTSTPGVRKAPSPRKTPAVAAAMVASPPQSDSKDSVRHLPEKSPSLPAGGPSGRGRFTPKPDRKDL